MVSDVSVLPTAGIQSGGSVTIQWHTTDVGNRSVTGAFYDTYQVVNLDTGTTVTTGFVSYDPTVSGSLAVAASVLRTQTITLPDGLTGTGHFAVTIDADAGNQIAETNAAGTAEMNNTLSATFQSALAPYPDLQISGLTVTPATGAVSGSTVTVSWNDVNTGTGPVTAAYYDRVVMRNADTGDILGTAQIIYDPTAPGNAPIAAGGQLARQTTFVLPDGAPGTGHIELDLTTDDRNQILEFNAAGTAEMNNTASATIVSTLAPYPDLTAANLSVDPNVSAGQSVTLHWSDVNVGTGPVTTPFHEEVVVRNLDAGGAVIADVTLLYDPATLGAIAANGGSVAQHLDVLLPNGSAGAGHLEFTVTVDSASEVFESNPAGDAEMNNQTSFSFTSALPPFPNLVASNVTAPTLTIGDPGQATVGWTVTNLGTGAVSASWYDAVYISTDDVFGNADDVLIGRFLETRSLAVNGGYTESRTITLPPALQGQFHLFVRTDDGDAVYENGAEADNVAEDPSLFDVTPTPYADLTVTAVNVPAAAESDQSMHVSWTIANEGIAVTNSGEWNDSVFLASDAAGTHIVAFLGNFVHDGPLPVGADYIRSADVAVPAGLAGNYYLVVETGGPYQFLNTLSDVGVSGPISLSPAPTPDLAVGAIVGPTQAVAGGTVDVSWTVTNTGTGDATGSWIDRVELTPVGGGAAIVLGSFTHAQELDAGLFYTRTEQLTLPTDLQGLYRITVITDVAGAVYEAGQTANNTASSTSAIQVSLPARPDLEVESIDVPTTLQAGAAESLSFVVVNQGPAAATGQWTDDVYLSLDDTISGDDTLVGAVTNGSALLPGQSYQSDLSFTVPQAAAGSYFVIVETDAGNVVDEIPNEDNNTLAAPITISAAPRPDLVAEDVIVPSQAFDGSTVTVTFTVANLGLGPTDAASWTDTLWLDVDRKLPTPSVGDVLLGSVVHNGSLAVGSSYDVTMTVTLPQHISGQYYLTPYADAFDQVLETTLDANTNPDDPTEIDNDNFKAAPISVLLSSPPDLVVTSVVAPSAAVAGTPYTVQWTVQNQGAAATEDSILFDKIYLSQTPTLDLTQHPTLLATVRHDGILAPGASYTATTTIDLSPADFGLYVLVDANTGGSIDEFDFQLPTYEGPFTDNNVRSAPSVVTNAPADLRVTNVSADATGFSGDPVNVSWTVTNFGAPVWSGTEFWYDDVYVSTDATFVLNRATYLGSYLEPNDGSLVTGGHYTQNQQITLPRGIDGTYYLYVFADASQPGLSPIKPQETTPPADGTADGNESYYRMHVFEGGGANEDNNSGQTTIAVTYREPDLVVSSITLGPNPPQASGILEVDWTVTNTGTRATHESDWFDGVFLSLDPSLGDDAQYLGQAAHIGILGAGDSYDVSLDVTLPSGIQGNYYLLVFTDSNLIGFLPPLGPGVQPEADVDTVESRVPEFRGEGNNVRSLAIDVAASELPDLFVSAIDIPQHAIVGQTVTISYTVTNQGAGDTPANQSAWEDVVYLSADPYLDLNTDRYLGVEDHTGGLAAGTSYSITDDFRLPSDLTGSFYVIVLTDLPQSASYGNVYEGPGESNNAQASPQPLILDQPPAADLQVASVTANADSADVGDTISVQWQTVNADPTNPVVGSFTDAVYLSADPNWDISDPLLGTLRYSGGLAAGASVTQNLNVAIPATAPGQYFLIVRTDLFNEIYEGFNEYNNATSSTDLLTVTVPPLTLNVPLATTLSAGQDRLYALTVPEGHTIQVSLAGSATGAVNEVFIKYAAAPTSSSYDFAYDQAFSGDQTVDIPNTQAGIYYILVHGQTEPSAASPVTLTATDLPFEITDIESDQGGDTQYVTTTIYGAQFDKNAIVKLIMPGFAEFEPVSYQVLDSTRIVAIFDLSSAPHGLYDVTVINPDGSEADLPYRYLVESTLPANVAIGLDGTRVLQAGQNGNYSFTLLNTTNFDLPYVEFSFGVPEVGQLDGKTALAFDTDLTGNPNVPGVDWSQLSSVADQAGELLASGYSLDLADGASTQIDFTALTYPDGVPNDPDGVSLDPATVAFQFHILATATPLTADEFVAQQTAYAEQLRSSILADPTATQSLKVLAANATSWDNLYLAALTQAGILRPQDEPPAVRTDPNVQSLISVLAAGILAGPAGDQIVTSGNLTQFFAQVHAWYGDDPATIAPLVHDPIRNFVIAPPPPASTFDLDETALTHYEAFNVYVRYANQIGVVNPDQPPMMAAASNNFTGFFSSAATQAATLTGPVGAGSADFVSGTATENYTIGFENPTSATSAVSSITIRTQLDPNLDPRSFRLGTIQIGSLTLALPSGVGQFDGDFDFTNSRGYLIHVIAGLDISTDTASWTIDAIDPLTGQVLSAGALGLLLAGDTGTVTYSVAPESDLATGAVIHAQARVAFNNSPPQDTNALVYTIDGVAPTTMLTATPLMAGSSDYQVSWHSVDDAGGSGVDFVTVYVSEDGGAWAIWLSDSTATSGVYRGQAGHSYAFLALATDAAGNQEAPPFSVTVPDDGNQAATTPTATTTADPPAAAPPAPSPSNPLFTFAQQAIPSEPPAADASEFASVLQPFEAQAFATGIDPSRAGVGPLAIVTLADGTVLASGGADRNELYRVSATGGEVGSPIAEEPFPIFSMAVDAHGNLWATTGGGPLLELDPTTGAILGQFGDSITQALAIDPTTGKIYVSSGTGIDIFDPSTHTFTHFSDERVGSLAFAPDGTLWGTRWPNRGAVLVFSQTGKAKTAVRLPGSVDSIAFGQAGTDLDGLAFVTTNNGTLYMIDLATWDYVALATGGTRGADITTTADGRVLLSQSKQIDVLQPLQAPAVAAVDPPPGSIVPLPLAQVSITFDEDMFVGQASDADSVLNLADYSLVGANSGPIAITAAVYDQATKTVILRFDAASADTYTLTVSGNLADDVGLTMGANYVENFQAVTDLTGLVDLEFDDVRSDRATGTISYDVKVVSTTDRDIILPLYLRIAPSQQFQGEPLGTMGRASDGSWLIDLSQSLPGGVLAPGQSTVGQTVTFLDPTAQRITVTSTVDAQAAANNAPIFVSLPIGTATAGTFYQYQADATDDSTAPLTYFLYAGSSWLTVDPATGLLSGTPTVGSPATSTVELQVYDADGAHDTQSFTISVAGVNRAPVFAALPTSMTGQEGQTLSFQVSATDADGDPLIYWADNLPGGATFDGSTQTFMWTPLPGMAGTYSNVTFTVSDGLHDVSIATQFLIAPTLSPPVFAQSADRVIREGDTVRIDLSATDPQGLPLTYESSFLPGGATLDPTTGIFQWTPTYFQHGVYDIPFAVTNGTASTTQTIRITVLNVNAAPVFPDLSDFEISEGQTLTVEAAATDPDNPGYVPPQRLADGSLSPQLGDPPSVTYVVTGLPSGATFDPDTQLFQWTPDFTQAGTYHATLSATDNGDGTGIALTTTAVMTIVVDNVDRPPTVAPIANVQVQRGQALAVPIAANDPDGDPIALSVQGLPSFATLVDNGDGTGSIELAPGVGDRGNYTLTVVATSEEAGDPVPLTASQTFIVTALSANEPPILTPIGDKVAIVGQPLSFTISASDLDQEPLTFSANGLPSGATLTPGHAYGTATFQWTPTALDAGVYGITFHVTDGGNGNPSLIATDSETIFLTVRSTNRAPVLAAISDQRISAGQTLHVAASASDPDGDGLLYLISNLPQGAVFDQHSGTLTWTPTVLEAGAYRITITATDGNLSASRSFAIDVAAALVPPVLTPLPTQSGREGSPLAFALVANDYQGLPLTFSSFAPLPTGATLDPRTGRFAWTPSYTQSGTYDLTFLATDSAGLSAMTTVHVTIADVDRPPVLTVTDHNAVLGAPLAFTLQGSDPDTGDTLTYSAIGLPDGATLDPATGAFAWTPAAGEQGDYEVTFAVSDGQLTATRDVLIRTTVNAVPPSVVVETTPSFPAVPGQTVQIHVSASSLSGIVALAVLVDGQAITLDSQGRGSVVAGTASRMDVVAYATDADGQVGEATTTILVRDPHDTAPPVVTLDPALAGYRVTGPVDLLGTVSDTNLNFWKIEIAPLGSSDYVTLAQGTGPVDGTILHLDPAGFANGVYQMILVAQDMAGRSAQDSAVFEIDSANKSLAFTTSATDLSTTLDGVPIDLTRTYDSLEANVAGAFGLGWQLALTQTDLQTSVVPTGKEALGVYAPFADGTRVYVTLPDGERVGFTFAPTMQRIGNLTYYTPSFVADDGVAWQLESASAYLTRAGGKYYDLKTGLAYNPASGDFTGSPYVLVAPDGTRYDLDGAGNVTEIDSAGGTRLVVSSCGIIAPSGERISFVRDAAGRIAVVLGPNGESILYSYDAEGHLLSVRQVQLGDSARYGYDDQDRLDLIVEPFGQTGEVIRYDPAPTAIALAADLGSTGQFSVSSTHGNLSASGEDLYSLEIAASELASTATGTLIVRVTLTRDTGSGIDFAVPTLEGTTFLESHVTANGLVALYAIDQAGLKLLDVSPVAGSAGAYLVHVAVAGDIDGNGQVDGSDAAALAALLGVHIGQPLYDPKADLNGDGTIDAADVHILDSNFGFTPAQLPLVSAGSGMTHVDLPVTFDLGGLLQNDAGDAVFFRVVAAHHGTAVLDEDGRSVTFTPDAGYSGPADFEFQANDAAGDSTIATFSVNVSSAPLIGLDFQDRDLMGDVGNVLPVQMIGTFADQANVPLAPSYVQITSSDPTIVSIDSNDVIHAVAAGDVYLLAQAQGLEAATVVTVGTPQTPMEELLSLYGFTVAYPDAVSLPAHVGTRQIDLEMQGADLSTASTGTIYVVSDPNVISVTPDGLIQALNPGTATVTVINGPQEKVIPVGVFDPTVGAATVGTAGGVVQGTDGSLLGIAPGALATPTMASIEPIDFASTGMPVPGFLNLGGAFAINLGNEDSSVPLQIAVPAPVGAAVGTTFYFYQQGMLPDATGTMMPTWIEEEVGVVGADGYIHTASPPEPGIEVTGSYMFASPNQQVTRIDGTVQIIGPDSASDDGGLVAITSAIGGGFGIGAIADFTSGVQLTLTLEQTSLTITKIPTEGPPLILHGSVQLSAGASNEETFYLDDVDPDADQRSAPDIESTDIRFNTPSDDPELVLTGTHFVNTENPLDASGDISRLAVTFTIGQTTYTVDSANSNPAEFYLAAGDTELHVVIPDTVTLGLADIQVERTDDLVTHDGDKTTDTKSVVDSNTVQVTPEPNYVFAAGVLNQVGINVESQVAVMTQPDATADDTLDGQPAGTTPPPPPNPLTAPTVDLVAEINVDPTVPLSLPRDVAVTNDWTRAYVTLQNDHGVAVLDAESLQEIDVLPDNSMVPSTLGVNHIVLPGYAEPYWAAVSPDDDFLYVSDFRLPTVYVIDINPESTTYNTLVAVMNGPTSAAPVGLRGLTVSPDGTRVVVGAPALTANNIGAVLVFDTDPKSQTYHQFLSKVIAGVNPTGITWVPGYTNEFAFVDEAANDIGLAIVQLDPTGKGHIINRVPMELGIPPRSEHVYYLEVNNAEAVVFLPDLTYAFVTGYDQYIPGLPDTDPYLDPYHPAGGDVGIIENPLNLPGAGDSKLIGATRPTPLAFPDNLVLSDDGKYLYAGYRGNHDVFVFDVTKIIAFLNSPGAVVKLFSRPIDDYDLSIDVQADYRLNTGPYTFLNPDDPLNPNENATDPEFEVADPNAAPVATGGDPEGLSAQSGSVVLVSPVGPTDSALPTFEWEYRGDEDIESAKLYVAAVPAGAGLFPQDTPPSLAQNPLLTIQGDENFTRIVNGVDLAAGTGWTLPENLELTRGQNYYWGVVVVLEDGRQLVASTTFHVNTPPARSPSVFDTVTIITPGFDPSSLIPTTISNFFLTPEGPVDMAPDSEDALAQEIAQQGGDGTVLYYDPSTGNWINPDGGSPALGKPLVLLFNWSAESAITESGFTEAAADALFASLVMLNDADGGAIFGSDIHLIGFSRGAVVNDELAQRLGWYEPQVGTATDLQMTTIDPHDFDQPSLNISALGSVNIGGVSVSVGNFSTFNEPPIVVWSNITFADNYYETAIPNVPNYVTFSPIGRAINGTATGPNGEVTGAADINLDLGSFGDFTNGRAGFTQDDTLLLGLGSGVAHSLVENWYAGTVDINIRSFPPTATGDLADNLFRRKADSSALWNPFFNALANPWYVAEESAAGVNTPYLVGGTPNINAPWEGTGEGWFYSVLGGGLTSGLRPKSSVPRTPVTYDNTPAGLGGDLAVPSIFNGNFQAGVVTDSSDASANKLLLKNEIPGWSFHGGSGGDTQGLSLGTSASNTYFILDAGGANLLTHNRLYVPTDVQNLRFDLQTVAASANPDAMLQVIMKDVETGETDEFDVSLTSTDANFVTYMDAVPAGFKGHVITITFQLQDAPGAKTYLDNVFFDLFKITDDSGSPDDDIAFFTMPETGTSTSPAPTAPNYELDTLTSATDPTGSSAPAASAALTAAVKGGIVFSQGNSQGTVHSFKLTNESSDLMFVQQITLDANQFIQSVSIVGVQTDGVNDNAQHVVYDNLTDPQIRLAAGASVVITINAGYSQGLIDKINAEATGAPTNLQDIDQILQTMLHWQVQYLGASSATQINSALYGLIDAADSKTGDDVLTFRPTIVNQQRQIVVELPIGNASDVSFLLLPSSSAYFLPPTQLSPTRWIFTFAPTMVGPWTGKVAVMVSGKIIGYFGLAGDAEAVQTLNENFAGLADALQQLRTRLALADQKNIPTFGYNQFLDVLPNSVISSDDMQTIMQGVSDSLQLVFEFSTPQPLSVAIAPNTGDDVASYIVTDPVTGNFKAFNTAVPNDALSFVKPGTGGFATQDSNDDDFDKNLGTGGAALGLTLASQRFIFENDLNLNRVGTAYVNLSSIITALDQKNSDGGYLYLLGRQIGNTMAHEFGHTLGLQEQYQTKSIVPDEAEALFDENSVMDNRLNNVASATVTPEQAETLRLALDNPSDDVSVADLADLLNWYDILRRADKGVPLEGDSSGASALPTDGGIGTISAGPAPPSAAPMPVPSVPAPSAPTPAAPSSPVANPSLVSSALLQDVLSVWQSQLGPGSPTPNIQIVVASLPGDEIAESTVTGFDADGRPDAGTITIDPTAQGVGWYVDSNPLADPEFTELSSDVYVAAPGSAAASKYDLFSALLHEVGHLEGFIAGWSGFDANVVPGPGGTSDFVGPGFTAILSADGSHLSATAQPDDLMNTTLYVGERRLPSVLDDEVIETARSTALASKAAVATTAMLEGSGAAGIAPPPGFAIRGSASIAGDVVTLDEDPQLMTEVTDSLPMAGLSSLHFTITQADLGKNSSGPSDAFEIAILDPTTMKPIAGVADGLTDTDAILNIQQDGQVFFGDRVHISGLTASGQIADLSQPLKVTIDLSGLSSSQTMSLYMDLLGFGVVDSSVAIAFAGLPGLNSGGSSGNGGSGSGSTGGGGSSEGGGAGGSGGGLGGGGAGGHREAEAEAGAAGVPEDSTTVDSAANSKRRRPKERTESAGPEPARAPTDLPAKRAPAAFVPDPADRSISPQAPVPVRRPSATRAAASAAATSSSATMSIRSGPGSSRSVPARSRLRTPTAQPPRRRRSLPRDPLPKSSRRSRKSRHLRESSSTPRRKRSTRSSQRMSRGAPSHRPNGAEPIRRR